MDKKDFIKALSKRTGLSISEARLALDTCLELIVSLNSNHEEVTFTGFGTFRVKHHRSIQNRRRNRFVPTFLPEKPFVESLS